MPGDWTIRAIRPDDAAALYEIRRQPMVQRFTFALPSERPKDFIATLGANDHVFVAEVGGRVVALAGLHLKDGKLRHSARVGIAVHDDFAGRGVGRALMEAIIDLAERWLGLVRVELEVFADNERGIALYRRFGFVEEGRKRKACFRDGEHIDAVLMARVR